MIVEVFDRLICNGEELDYELHDEKVLLSRRMTIAQAFRAGVEVGNRRHGVISVGDVNHDEHLDLEDPET